MANASRLYLPKLESPPATVLDHLIAHFPQIPAEVWRSRVARGLIQLSDGTVVMENSAYRYGVHVLYPREVPAEPNALEDEQIIYQDEEILVADKPHGMPVTPAGPYLERALVTRLQRRTGIDTLAPMHRLDRDTAGIVLFTKNLPTRGRYHQLFARGEIEREYLALAHVRNPPDVFRWHVENRIGPGEPWFRRRIVEGPANAITDIELLEVRDGVGRFRLLPRTGKKHQLRLHMASIGFAIIGDALYPEIRTAENHGLPLQLLANRLTFNDPLGGLRRSFRSLRSL
jgi:tRNA pseudouridine32 synthase/23S rRNA pseudouridine746 synthase